ncbi:hypothetical protein Hanom_Chr09g00760681 [Helianthus anomalus]
MDHENNAPSLLKLIEDYDPIFFELFVDQKQISVVKDDFCIRNYDSVYVNRLCFYK